MMLLFFKAAVRGGAAADLFAAKVPVAGYTTEDGTFVAPHQAVRHKLLVRPAPPAAKAPAQTDLFAQPPAPKPPQPDLFARPASPPAASAAPAAPATPITADDRVTWQNRRGSRRYSMTGQVKEIERNGVAVVHMLTADSGSGFRAPYPNTIRVPIENLTRITGTPASAEPVPASAAPEKPAETPKSEPSSTAIGTPGTPRNTAEQDRAAKPAKAAPKPSQPADWGMPAGTSQKARKAANAAALALLEAKADGDMTPEDRAVLARYTGRGGIGDSLNEFYTEPAVARAMWDMLRSVGFAGGDVLEPSAGTGVFLHVAPPGAHVTAVEMAPTAARIAKILHEPAGHDVHAASLERFATQDGRQFDAVIGNVPFCQRGSLIADDKPDLARAEQYFVDTALDKCRDGGLVALIVPTGIMDSRSGRSFRERLLRKGQFLGAHRLPNTAFRASHTEVTSDIVLFRKRPADVAGALSTVDVEQDQLRGLGVWDDDFLSGAYFTTGRGAANIHGTMEAGWRAKAGLGDDITVSGSMAGVPAQLAAWQPPAEDLAPNSPPVRAILESLGDDEAAVRRARSAAAKPAYQVAQLGDVRVIEGVRYVLQGEIPRWHRADAEIPAAVAHALPIADTLHGLAEGRSVNPHAARAELGEALAAYVAQHGVPHRNRDLQAWLAKPSLPVADDEPAGDHAARVDETQRRVARLLGAVNDDGSYSDLVTGRTLATDAAGLDILATRLAVDSGGFTPAQLATAAAAQPDVVLDYLHASPDFAVNADGQTWTTLDNYLAGELWPKLDDARAAAESDTTPPDLRAKYAKQALALEEAISPASLEDVEVLPTSGFVQPEDLTAFFTAMDDAHWAANPKSTWGPGRQTVTFDGALYHIKNAKTGAFGLSRDAELLEKMLNRTGVRKDDLPAVERLNEKFKKWLLASDIRDKVEERYNRTYRGFRQQEYSNSPIAIPGMVTDGLKAFQYGGVRWALAAGRGIIAADVGLGKTVRGLMLAKLARVTGQAKRPTFVVPKSVLSNWIAEANKWFPGSRILVIGETHSTDKDGNLVSKADDEKTRRKKYHQLQQNEYDFVFVSQPAWNDLDINPITKGQLADDDFWAKRGKALGNAGDKRLNQLRTAHDQAIAQREFSKHEETIYFEDLGIDMLLLDEAQAFKNLFAAKNRFGESPKFLGGSGLSNRAQDTNFKTQVLRQKTGGKGVYMLTATPTKNSPLEIYSMLSHVAPEAFTKMGIDNSEGFLDRFCTFETGTILGLDGNLTETLITTGFKNLNELREVMRRYIDRKTAADVGLELPRRDDRQHTVAMTPEQQATYHVLREQAAAAKDGDATGDAHIFSIMDKMGKATLDLGLLDPADAGAKSPKIEAVVQQVSELVNEGGQIIFCESVPTHERIVADLVAAGIPRDRIAIINGAAAPTSAARQRISDAFNDGRIQVVVANKTAEEGINLQKATSDIHHLDLPWEPASLQQRNGRGLRQGNKKEAVRIHTYLMKGTFDGYRWQTVAAKKDWQDLLWNGGDRVENLAREGAMSREEMLIMLSADPDAAREKYASDKNAAEQRQTAEMRGRANDTFVRFQEMRQNRRALVAKGAKGLSVERLGQRIARLEETLRDSKWFTHKDLLDSDEPAIVEPNTGFAWTRGKAFEIAAGRAGPVNWSNEPSRWVVEGVDPAEGKILARPWGKAGAASTISMDAARFKAGVKPIEYDEKAEAAEIQARALGSLSSVHSVSEVANLPPDLVAKHEAMLTRQVRAAMQAHQNSADSYGPKAFISPAGEPMVAETYDIASTAKVADPMLPTAANRAKATAAYVAAQLDRRIKSNLQSGGRHSYGRTIENGIAALHLKDGSSYSGSPSNPWEPILTDLFGRDAFSEARAHLLSTVGQRISAAPDLKSALEAAQSTVDVSPHGGVLRSDAWPQAVVRQLRAKAQALGVLDHTVSQVIGSPGHRPEKLHPGLFRMPRLPSSALTSVDWTVGRFLDHLLHPDAAETEDKEAA